jgi:hypothetical protein
MQPIPAMLALMLYHWITHLQVLFNSNKVYYYKVYYIFNDEH